ncbi:hypothetical protein [Salinigranum halophilum]|uniref:hypothetical protein n=1 Tax=Salinigranum halophilum TaxID=2565931 RepID=UPI0010A7D4A8|nr:hypothetical protein [Salinigranum halophilum]
MSATPATACRTRGRRRRRETDVTPPTHVSGRGLWLAQSTAEANGGAGRVEADAGGDRADAVTPAWNVQGT